ncbi:hypothetical protein Tco_1137179, partial [Tanacetum coccineum]
YVEVTLGLLYMVKAIALRVKLVWMFPELSGVLDSMLGRVGPGDCVAGYECGRMLVSDGAVSTAVTSLKSRLVYVCWRVTAVTSSTWMAFGGNTRDLGSFREETDKTTTLPCILKNLWQYERRGERRHLITKAIRDVRISIDERQ